MEKEESFFMAALLLVILMVAGLLSLDISLMASYLEILNTGMVLGLPVGVIAVIGVLLAVVYYHEKGK